MDECLTVIWIKNGLYIPAFLMAIGFPEQTSWSIMILTVLMLTDFVTGVLASIRIDGLKSVTSRRMTAGAVSKMIIIMIPFIVAITGKGLGIDFMTYVQGSLSILILAEAYSNLGNIQSYRSGIRVPEIDAISLVLKRVRVVIMDMLKKSE